MESPYIDQFVDLSNSRTPSRQDDSGRSWPVPEFPFAFKQIGPETGKQPSAKNRGVPKKSGEHAKNRDVPEKSCPSGRETPGTGTFPRNRTFVDNRRESVLTVTCLIPPIRRSASRPSRGRIPSSPPSAGAWASEEGRIPSRYFSTTGR